MNKIFLCGDIVLQTQANTALVTGELRNLLNQCEVVCGNLEGTIKYSQTAKLKKKGPRLQQDGSIIDLIRDAGFNVLIGANNHIMDWGYENVLKLKKDLYDIPLIGVGESFSEVFEPYIYRLDNQKTIGIIAVCEGGFGAYYPEYVKHGYAWMCDPRLEDVIRNNAQDVDCLIVCCHAGAEELEVPLPEIRQLYRRFIDWGASVVVGSHPHVVQGLEEYGDGTIFYSVGNFFFRNNVGFYNPYSIAIVLDLSGMRVKYELLPLMASEDGVELCCDTSWKKEIEARIRVLNDTESYQKKVEKFCVRQYNDFYRNAFVGATGNLFYWSLKDRIRSVYYLLFKKNKLQFDDVWIEHNYYIETHRWTIMRALHLMDEMKFKLGGK